MFRYYMTHASTPLDNRRTLSGVEVCHYFSDNLYKSDFTHLQAVNNSLATP
ncbi:MAG: hypothetical protein GY801_01480 [bacterium]|nr:hypothetical protein [bacterium]